MKIILLEDVKKLGKAGDVVEVADGYAANYLFPRNLAQEATKSGLKQVKQKQKALENKRRKQKQQAIELGKKLSASNIVIHAKSGEQGKLFGSITSKDISEAIKKQHKLDVDKRKIALDEPIKALGEYKVTIKLLPEVETNICVQVVEG